MQLSHVLDGYWVSYDQENKQKYVLVNTRLAEVKLSKPLVTVAIPSYNHERYVRQSVLSVINQDYPNIELIVIDDGSRDSSRAILSSLSEKYNFLYIEQENEGISKTLNRAISMASGAYISFLASDDYFYPYKISKLVNAFQRAPDDTAMIFGDADLVNDQGNIVERVYKGRVSSSFINLYHRGGREFLKNKKYISYSDLIWTNFVPAMSTMCDLEKIRKLGMFPESYRIEDYPMWLKIVKRYGIRYIDEVVSAYRQHDNNSIIKQRNEFTLEQLRILSGEWGYAFRHGMTYALLFRLVRLSVAYAKGKFR